MSRILKICGKTSDSFSATLEVDGKDAGEYVGYVPSFFPGEHYGDYIQLHIDIDTGEIVNWKKPTKKELTEMFDAKKR
jgi:hypothetical protein